MDSFLKRYIAYCATGELLGIGAAGAIAYTVNHLIGEPETLSEKLIVLLSMMGAGCIEGFLLGTFQWKILKEKLPLIPRTEWIGYTVLIAALGWFLGMLPSLFLADSGQATATQQSDTGFSNPFVFAILCIAIGLGIGSIFGLFQWFSLRKYAGKAYLWIVANALGWGLGIGWIYLAASLPDENTPLASIILLGIGGGLLAGTSVGAVTGIFLKRLQGI